MSTSRKFDFTAVQAATRALLEAIGEDPDREGLRETPRRYAKFWEEFMEYEDDNIATTFRHFEVDQLVVVSGVRVWSLCEHHLLPFWCDVTMGYLATNRVLGLSKFARIARLHAHRLNVQEALVSSIGRSIAELTDSADVAVIAEGEHTCMTMRGVREKGKMTSSFLRGGFKDTPMLRSEFMRLAAR